MGWWWLFLLWPVGSLLTVAFVAGATRLSRSRPQR